MIKEKKERFVKYDGKTLYLRVNGQERVLGSLLTRYGGLSRYEKLKAVEGKGEWVKI